MTHPLLYDYQNKNLELLINAIVKFGAALDGSDTGTGKTFTAAALCSVMKLTPFVICPKTIVSKWAAVLDYFNVKPLFIGNYESFKFNKYRFAVMPRGYKPRLIADQLGLECNIGYSYVCETWDKALAFLSQYGRRRITDRYISAWEDINRRNFNKSKCRFSGSFQWRLNRGSVVFIFDEVQKCKNPLSINAKMLVAAKKFRVLALSATPAHNPRELKALGYILGLHDYEHFNEWSMAYGCRRVTVTDPVTGDERMRGWRAVKIKENMKKIHSLIYPAHGGRVRIADLGDAFPETQIKAELYDVDNWERHNKLYELLLGRIEQLREMGDRTADILIEILRFRQAAELMKVPLLTDLTKEYLSGGFSVVVFCNYDHTINALSRDLKTGCIVKGTKSANEEVKRGMNIQDFQHNRQRVVLCNITAGGVGLDLHDKRGNFPRVALLCPTYDAFALKQALGRVHRAGGKSKSLQRIVYAAKTIEEKVCLAVNSKMDCISALNDGDLMETDLLKLHKRVA